MKKIILALLILGMPCFAVSPDVYRASNTATADTLKNICPGQGYVLNGSTVTFGNRGVLHSVCINAGVPGTLTIFDSSSTATIPIAAITTSTGMPCSIFDVGTSSGLTYTNSATANVTMTYGCY